MRIQIGKYIIKNCDERNLVIVEQRPAGKNPKTGEMGTGVKEVTVGYYPNLEWALHMLWHPTLPTKSTMIGSMLQFCLLIVYTNYVVRIKCASLRWRQ